jgi:hypothetical protein
MKSSEFRIFSGENHYSMAKNKFEINKNCPRIFAINIDLWPSISLLSFKVIIVIKSFLGIQLDTKEGSKFVMGQMVKTDHGEIFMPGTFEYGKTGKAKFHAAKNIGEVVLHDAPACDFSVIDPHSLEVHDPNLSVFGNMVQTEDGIEFFPEKIGEGGLPPGATKTIPGKLIKQGTGLHSETKFVPGIMTEEGFIPGRNEPRKGVVYIQCLAFILRDFIYVDDLKSEKPVHS